MQILLVLLQIMLLLLYILNVSHVIYVTIIQTKHTFWCVKANLNYGPFYFLPIDLTM